MTISSITHTTDFNAAAYVSNLTPLEAASAVGIVMLECKATLDSSVSETLEHYTIHGILSSGERVPLKALDTTTADGRNAGLKHTKYDTDTKMLQAVFFESDFTSRKLTSILIAAHTKQSVSGAALRSRYTSTVEIQVKDIVFDKFPVTHPDFSKKDQTDGDGVIIDTLQGLQKNTQHVVGVTCWGASHDMSQNGSERAEGYDWDTLRQQTFTGEFTTDANGELPFVLGTDADVAKMAKVVSGLTNSAWQSKPERNLVNESMMGEVDKLHPGASASVCVQAFAEVGKDKARVYGEMHCLTIKQSLDCPEHVLVKTAQVVQTGERTLTVKLTGDQKDADDKNVARASNDAYTLGYVVRVGQAHTLTPSGNPETDDIEIAGKLDGASFLINEKFAEDATLKLEFLAAVINTDGSYTTCPDNSGAGNEVIGKIARALSAADMDLAQTDNTATDLTGALDKLRLTISDDLKDRVYWQDSFQNPSTGVMTAVTKDFAVDKHAVNDLRSFSIMYKAAGDGSSGHFAMAEQTGAANEANGWRTSEMSAGAYAILSGTIRQVIAHEQLTLHLKTGTTLAATNKLDVKLKDGTTDPVERTGLITTVEVTDLDGNTKTGGLTHEFSGDLGNTYQSLGKTMVATGSQGTYKNTVQRQSNVTNDQRLALVAATHLSNPTPNYGNSELSFDVITENNSSTAALTTRTITASHGGETKGLSATYTDKATGQEWTTTTYTVTQTVEATKGRAEIEPSPSYSYARIGETRVSNLVQKVKTVNPEQSFEDTKLVEATLEYKAANTTTWTALTDQLGDINFRMFTHNTVDGVTAGDDYKNGRTQYSTLAGGYISGATDGKVDTSAAELDKVLQAVVHACVTASPLGQSVNTLKGTPVRTGNQGTSRWSLPSKGLLTTAVRGTTKTDMDTDGYAVTDKIAYVTTKPATTQHDAQYQLYYERTEGLVEGVRVRNTETTSKGDITPYKANGDDDLTISECVTVSGDFSYGAMETKVEIVLTAKDTTNYFDPGTFVRTSAALVARGPKGLTRDSKHVDIMYTNAAKSAAKSINTDKFTADTTDCGNDGVVFTMADDDNDHLQNQSGAKVDVVDADGAMTLVARLSYNDTTPDSDSAVKVSADTASAGNDYEGTDHFIIIDGSQDMSMVAVGNGNVTFSQALISAGTAKDSSGALITATDGSDFQEVKTRERFRMSSVGSSSDDKGKLRVLQTNVGGKTASMTWRDTNGTVQKYFTSAKVCFEAMPNGMNEKYTDVTGKPMTIEYHGGSGKVEKSFTQDPDPKLFKVTVSGAGAIRRVVAQVNPGYNSTTGNTQKTSFIVIDTQAQYGTGRTGKNLKVYNDYAMTRIGVDHDNNALTPDSQDTMTDPGMLGWRTFQIDDVVVRNAVIEMLVMLFNESGSGHTVGTLRLPAGRDNTPTVFDIGAINSSPAWTSMADKSDNIG